MSENPQTAQIKTDRRVYLSDMAETRGGAVDGALPVAPKQIITVDINM
jgi:hypothetical protein